MRICDLYDIDSEVEVNKIKINSKEIEPGDIFVCTIGVTADRHDFIDEAIENGASLVVVSRDVGVKKVPVVQVENTNYELISLARRLYKFENGDLHLLGVTGTNGKTTITLMIKYLLGDACGYIGTNGLISKSFQEKIRNTTPDADRLYMYFRKFIDDGCKYLSMETSSEAFYRKRLDTLEFEVGIISNITEDHLNIHKTIENYVDSKMELLKKVKEDGVTILNTDDKYFDLAKENARGEILTFGEKAGATLQIVNVLDTDFGSHITYKYQDRLLKVDSPYLGIINAYNLAASILCVLHLGVSMDEILEKIPSLPVIEGRLQEVGKGNFSVILDYAHTTDAFMKILPILNKRKKNKLIVVTGSAGGREQEKRAPMGKYILEEADHVIFTMDDPRYERVLDIISDLVSASNLTNYEIIEDRKKAIYKALDMASSGDVVLVAGKGVDNYMAVEDKYLPYSDVEVISEYFKERNL